MADIEFDDNVVSNTVIYDKDGVAMAVTPGNAIPTGVRGFLSVGEDDNGKARVIKSSLDGSITINASDTSGGAFGELRTAVAEAAANIINKYEIDPKEIGTNIVGSASITHVPAKSAMKLEVTSASGDKAKARSHAYYRYQAGKGTRILTTAYHADTGQTNQVRRWGIFDDNDGLFFELNGTTLYVVIRSSTSGSVVDTKVAQSNWNRDPFDGTGISEITLDITKGQIWEIQFQWLGVGKVNFFINGYLVHSVDNPNNTDGPYMRTAVLPVSWEIENTGASTASHFHSICTSVNIEGTSELPEYSFGAYNDADITVGTTERPLLSIRPKLTYNSIENRMSIFPILLAASNEGGRSAIRLVLDATLTGASWTSAASESGVEYDTSATALSGGTSLIRIFLPASEDSTTLDISKFFAALGRALRREAFGTNVRTLTITGKYEKQSGSTSMRASLTWGESR